MLLVITWHLGRAGGRAKAMLPCCLLAISAILPCLECYNDSFFPFPGCLVNTGKVMLNGCDGQKPTIQTCTWVRPKEAWRCPLPLQAHLEPKSPWLPTATLGIPGNLLSQHICCLDSGSAQTQILDPCFDAWILLPTLVLCSQPQPFTVPLHPLLVPRGSMSLLAC